MKWQLFSVKNKNDIWNINMKIIKERITFCQENYFNTFKSSEKYIISFISIFFSYKSLFIYLFLEKTQTNKHIRLENWSKLKRLSSLL